MQSLGKKKREKESSGSFEQSLARLGEIVDRLEDGELPLDESLRLFEEGMALVKTSQETLTLAEKRVEELISVDDSGVPKVRDVTDEDG